MRTNYRRKIAAVAVALALGVGLVAVTEAPSWGVNGIRHTATVGR